ncbi:peptide N-acetyl-beta-D-glucosaminyl asparaginase amidase A-domain-containing protein [Colletotrichum phormii]|uniref:Peptide N-acetyl-beta-D-glucosaminyl asparaginase amidase A-domain-containing protein n=1 Tax=Colletotrichum phormii TaxID=359342 RepID=A0AAJ0A0P4_9PEZI|nr:peptide N-acetyl-beta-D-glucosaminyl asparaginase amidase A-domain-containing protein [Colletotrichum phormii]KAK1654294.1 peptide N-acetyl-beta-D-glucosaminyl asparaginase amidase A-domain-containing protein [Colletotrichum phormii]
MAPRPVSRALALSLFVLVLNTGYVASRNLIPAAALSDYVTRQQGIIADTPAPMGTLLDAEGGQQQKPLDCFQVAQPVLGPKGPVYQALTGSFDDGKGKSPATDPKDCKVQLMDHSFGNSFGKPFLIGDYKPPGCDFNRVIVNFTATSAGRQLDRLALLYLGDTEVWRTSTAEPRAPPGIIWTYWKDMTPYLSLWKTPQKIIFDLPNLIDDMFTGPFNCTLTATFFKSDVETDSAPPADHIIPISSRNASSNTGSAWLVPEREAVSTVKFPRNANRAVFSVSANGQGTEEFWWSNVLQSDAAAFNATVGMAPDGSPWREVQVIIDDQLAGVQWPFPVIFTGGVVPSFHRPLVGLDAYDLREHEIDISPWLPVLSDGKEHTFKIKVAGLADDGQKTIVNTTVGNFWVVSGKVFLWLDEEGSITTGKPPTVSISDPDIKITGRALGKNSTGANETLAFNLDVTRMISVKGEVVSKKGTKNPEWTQKLSYTNNATLGQFGRNGFNNFIITGTDELTGMGTYKSTYSYPLIVNQTANMSANGDLSLDATLFQELRLEVEGVGVYPTGLEAYNNPTRNRQGQSSQYKTSKLSTFRNGTAVFNMPADMKSSSAFGTTRQVFRFSGGRDGARDVELYTRRVRASNNTVLSDEEKSADGREKVLTVSNPLGEAN